MSRFLRAAIPAFLFLSAVFAFIRPAAAQPSRTTAARKIVTAVRARGPIKIDGVLSEPDWSIRRREWIHPVRSAGRAAGNRENDGLDRL